MERFVGGVGWGKDLLLSLLKRGEKGGNKGQGTCGGRTLDSEHRPGIIFFNAKERGLKRER